MLAKLFDAITRLALRFRWVTIGVALVIMVAGGLALSDLNQELLPRIEFPQTIIIAQWGGAEDAEDFLEEVTIPDGRGYPGSQWGCEC
ncbi:MAG: efflux RND transporter permease subunit [Chloroflexi bacterium]|nr:efflux RND transporter permease subunit [Chloroflexota bacterium]